VRGITTREERTESAGGDLARRGKKGGGPLLLHRDKSLEKGVVESDGKRIYLPKGKGLGEKDLYLKRGKTGAFGGARAD